MGTIKDVYEIVKELIQEAKRIQNQEVVSLAMDVQIKLFDLKEEIEQVKDENKLLKEDIRIL